MGFMQKFVDKATLVDEEYDDEYLDDVYEDEGEVAEEPEVTPIRSVAPMPDLSRIVTVRPRSFNDIQAFADEFRKGLPVILNLAETNEDDRRRIVDFATGVCYGLRGLLNPISDDVLLMTPHTVKVESRRSEPTRTF